jgi:hypothetical protein
MKNARRWHSCHPIQTTHFCHLYPLYPRSSVITGVPGPSASSALRDLTVKQLLGIGLPSCAIPALIRDSQQAVDPAPPNGQLAGSKAALQTRGRQHETGKKWIGPLWLPRSLALSGWQLVNSPAQAGFPGKAFSEFPGSTSPVFLLQLQGGCGLAGAMVFRDSAIRVAHEGDAPHWQPRTGVLLWAHSGFQGKFPRRIVTTRSNGRPKMQ